CLPLVPHSGQPQILKIETWSGDCLAGSPPCQPRPRGPVTVWLGRRPANRGLLGPRFTFLFPPGILTSGAEMPQRVGKADGGLGRICQGGTHRCQDIAIGRSESLVL